MTTTVVYYEDALNIDYLLPSVRLNFGDLDGTVFTDVTVRTAIVNAVKMLQHKWTSKYQVYEDILKVDPQPIDVPPGYILANTMYGQAYIPDKLFPGDAFRNPYIEFTTPEPTITSEDDTAIILAATYLLRKAQASSSSNELASWSTEDIRFNSLSKDKSIANLLDADKQALDDYFRKKLAKPIRVTYPIGYIPGLHDIWYNSSTQVTIERNLL
jgi:hypothetical protein